MKKIYIYLLTLIILVYPNVISAYYSNRTGAYDEKTNSFYFDGGSFTYWSRKKGQYDSKAIYEYDFNKKTQIKYFSAENEITDLKMSSDSQMISFIEFKGDKNILKVINKYKKVLAEINSLVQNYCWGLDSKKLYYITGKTDSELKPPIIPDGVWMYDIVTNKEQKIAEKGWDITNVLFDNNIYFWNGDKYLRYNVTKNKVEKTDIKETDMTQNKRYYIHYLHAEDPDAWEPPYWSPFRIFDTQENQDLPPEKILFISERDPGEVMWAMDSKTIIFRGNIERKIYDQQMYVYNFVDNQLIKTFKGKVFGMNHERTKLVVLRDGALFLETIASESGS